LNCCGIGHPLGAADKSLATRSNPVPDLDESKVPKRCTLSLTGQAVINRTITNLGVVPRGLKIVDLADGMTATELRAAIVATILN
jgi:acyl CoA:acetate/3-ketoacid CoA transferase beta subunit